MQHWENSWWRWAESDDDGEGDERGGPAWARAAGRGARRRGVVVTTIVRDEFAINSNNKVDECVYGHLRTQRATCA